MLPEKTHAFSRNGLDADANSLHDSRNSDRFDITQTHSFDPDSLLPSPDVNEPDPENPDLVRSTTNDTLRTHRHVRPSPGGSISHKTLVPIQLGPVVLRDASEKSHEDMTILSSGNSDSKSKRQHQRSESTQNLLSNASHPSYFDNREPPHQKSGRHSADTLTSHPPSHETLATRATPSTHPLSSSSRQHARDTTTSSSPPTLTERPKTGARLQRKRTNQAKGSFSNPVDSDVEKEILELNTIVEERRAETNRARPRDSRHVPAVAPSMQVGVRSQTLNDIGSALSRPLAAHQVHSKGSKAVAELDSNAQRPRSARVSGWLSNVPPPTTAGASDNNEVFYGYDAHGCDADITHERNVSMNSSGTGLDSVLYNYTLDSSPTASKRGSRSLMVTPLTPVDDSVGCDGERRVGPVGVAL